MSRPLLLLAALGVLSGCDADLDAQRVSLPTGQAAPPLVMSMTPVIPGNTVTLTVEGAAPGDVVRFGVGALGLFCGPVLLGACLDLAPAPTYLGQATADGTGTAVRVVTAPAALPPGNTYFFQAIVLASGNVSNVVSRKVDQDCTFGDVLAATGTVGDIYDQDRITHDASTVFLSTFAALVHYDEDLVPTGVSVPNPTAGNHGVTYSPFNGLMYAYNTATFTASVNAFDPYTGVVAVSSNTGDNTGGAAVMPDGTLFFPKRISPGTVFEFDAAMTPSGTWSSGSNHGFHDAEISEDGGRLVRVGGNRVEVHDLTSASRPLVASWVVPPGLGGPNVNLYDAALAPEGVIYLVDRGSTYRVLAYHLDGTFLGEAPSTLETVAVDYNPSAHALYVGNRDGSGNSLVRKLCPF